MLESPKQTSSGLAALQHPLSHRGRGESWMRVDMGPGTASYDAEQDHHGGCWSVSSESAGKKAWGGTNREADQAMWATRKSGGWGRWLPEALRVLRQLSGEAAYSGLGGRRGKRRSTSWWHRQVDPTSNCTWIWAALPPGSEPVSHGPSQIIQSRWISLVVQWLRRSAPSVEGLGSIPGQGTRAHMLQLRVHKDLPCHTRTRDCVCPN